MTVKERSEALALSVGKDLAIGAVVPCFYDPRPELEYQPIHVWLVAIDVDGPTARVHQRIVGYTTPVHMISGTEQNVE
ncbi:MAG: hypothetical protein WB239_14585 [Acidimicrobiia bacterium]